MKTILALIKAISKMEDVRKVHHCPLCNFYSKDQKLIEEHLKNWHKLKQ